MGRPLASYVPVVPVARRRVLVVLIGRRLTLLKEDESVDRLAMVPITYGCAWDMATADNAGGD